MEISRETPFGRLRLVPLGDQAVLAYLSAEDAAAAFAEILRAAGSPWIVDIVPAYRSVAVFYDQEQTQYRGAAEKILAVVNAARATSAMPQRRHVIPCCYDMQLDLDRVAGHLALPPERIIELHSSALYTVYAIGFCPGFPYLGYLPSEIAGVPRLPSPRLRVEPGSVGMTGRQTGVYPLERPGGWNLIGGTPLELVNIHDSYFPLRAGDRVQFRGIDQAEFRRLRGNRL